MSLCHSNISVFVPHVGCPNMCSFCDQRHITGVKVAPATQDVKNAVNTALSSKNYDPKTTEIAFFGGSFTAINRNYMFSLLDVAYSFVKNGVVSGIRVSTRPDAISDEILNALKSYGVTSIELGAQSMDNEVLKANNRGHTAEDVEKASELIKEYGFSLGLQMMTGLYGDNDEKTLNTAEKIIRLKPETVRIYPTIVLKDTTLAALYADGYYKPQTVDEAVSICTKLLKMFFTAGIKVIRLGLHSIDTDAYVGGPWHPAFSELCFSEIFLEKALGVLGEKGEYRLFVSPENLSKMIGQNKENIKRLKDMGYVCRVMPDSSLKSDEIYAERGDSVAVKINSNPGV
ncbi:MAG: radical SAM protein [Clostridia bacterium]|nr:radical SAM protein [Clostridia bacterium]